ncbi:hypothetical protein ACFOOK_10735 [Micromonospora krabiensis]|uniref:Uncharacterized protein n=1 Tax=Micromonospora krabiensis TaxID=307121 RepID=A0A1C3NAD5_9ACTN|nr:hypothetical protein [Micromonospora krabiensis]SBV29531.1 hypothetical protein GA0070620_5108 [Micromonospora krabiensis]
MSGRRLGRLLGSLFILAAFVSGIGSVDLRGSAGSGAQAADIIWHSVPTDPSIAQTADIIWH